MSRRHVVALGGLALAVAACASLLGLDDLSYGGAGRDGGAVDGASADVATDARNDGASVDIGGGFDVTGLTFPLAVAFVGDTLFYTEQKQIWSCTPTAAGCPRQAPLFEDTIQVVDLAPIGDEWLAWVNKIGQVRTCRWNRQCRPQVDLVQRPLTTAAAYNEPWKRVAASAAGEVALATSSGPLVCASYQDCDGGLLQVPTLFDGGVAYSVAFLGDTLYAGTGTGVVRRADGGLSMIATGQLDVTGMIAAESELWWVDHSSGGGGQVNHTPPARTGIVSLGDPQSPAITGIAVIGTTVLITEGISVWSCSLDVAGACVTRKPVYQRAGAKNRGIAVNDKLVCWADLGSTGGDGAIRCRDRAKLP